MVRRRKLVPGNPGMIVILYFSLHFNCLLAQNDTLVFYPVNNTLLQQYYIRRITIANDGILWLSTNQGIVSYDGNDVQNFGGYNNFGSFTNQKNDLYLIRLNGIYYFDTKTGNEEYLDITLKPEDYSPDPRTYTDIYADNDESIWCGRTDGFLHYNRLTKKTTFYRMNSALNSERIAVRNIQGDIKDNDILWFPTDDGIYWFNKHTKKLQRKFNCSNPQDSSASDAMVSKIQISNRDTIWFIGGERGVGCYDIKKGQYTIYPRKKEESGKVIETSLTFLQAKNKDEYYIGSSGNSPGTFNTYTHQYTFNSKTYKELPALKIDHFTADSTGNLWCIIAGQLFYASANKNKFATIPLHDHDYKSHIENIFKTVIWDKTRKCYYAAFDNSDVIFVLDSNMKAIKSIPIRTRENGIDESREPDTYDISLDNQDHLWSCGTTVCVFDSLTQSMVPAQKLYRNLLFHDQRFQNIICRNNYLYLQPSNPVYKAIYRVNLVSFTYDSIPIPYDIIPNGYENSWYRRDRQEVTVIDKQGKYAYIGMGNYILQLNLLTRRGKKITRVTVRDNGFYFNMFWYALDDDGNLWVTSTDGIKVINPSSLEIGKKIHDGYETNHFQLYNAEGMGTMCLLYSGGIKLYDYRNNKEYHLSLSDGLITLFNSGIACVNAMVFVGGKFDALQSLKLNSTINRNTERKCYLTDIRLFNTPYGTDTLPRYLHSLQLPHDGNFISFTFSSTEFEEAEQIEYRYRLEGIDKDWINTNYLDRTVSYPDLKPGNYIFYTSIKNRDGSWNDNEANLHINIIPAWWQTIWFTIVYIIAALSLSFMLIRWRIIKVREEEQLKVKQEQEKSKIEKAMLELEAKALRAQMNPHFIFNCLNSIKSLIQQNENEKSVTYLTTFSKLIRTLLNNADKKEITLYDEIETCKLYLQLEAMRFDTKFSFAVNVDNHIDLKSIRVPALIIQPFIENAIWHGIVPRNSGGQVSVNVLQKNSMIEVAVEDDGIGRQSSQQNKSTSGLAHQSKGVNLTQSRLELNNLLQQRQAKLEIIDKRDKNGTATGTKVIIHIKEEFS